MGAEQHPGDAQARWWWERLLFTNAWFRRGRVLFRHLPADPRCKLCAAPFKGAAAPVLRLFGKRPWSKNPKYCGSCFKNLESHRGGIEIECTLLFADVRGSTPPAERIDPTAVRELMNRFYDTAAHVLVEHDAIVDKFVAPHIELTALGDPVNVAARLASAAGAGEILVTQSTAVAANLGEDGLVRRSLDLKGKREPVSVPVVTA